MLKHPTIALPDGLRSVYNFSFCIGQIYIAGDYFKTKFYFGLPDWSIGPNPQVKYSAVARLACFLRREGGLDFFRQGVPLRRVSYYRIQKT